MKRTASFLALTAAMASASAASAQRPPHATTSTTAADFTEERLDGDQVVTFTGDELAGLPNGAYGDTIRRPPGIMRVGLIRPRVNFVSELLKSVESL